YYASAATLESLLGCYTVDWVSRKRGEKSLERYLSHKRYEYITRHIKKHAAWALAIASLTPPPFPFTPFVAAASALQYPRKRLFAVVGITRLARFSTEGLLAILMGERIIRLARSRAVEGGIAFLVVISVLGSAFSIHHWFIAGGERPPRTKRKPAARR
ncbi:MAG: VTT domain-containing protein, partial [Terriglobia bacterium]